MLGTSFLASIFEALGVLIFGKISIFSPDVTWIMTLCILLESEFYVKRLSSFVKILITQKKLNAGS